MLYRNNADNNQSCLNTTLIVMVPFMPKISLKILSRHYLRY